MRVVRRIATLIATVSAVLAIAPTAAAAPWDGGWYVASPLEVVTTNAVQEITKRPVVVVCNSPEQWAYLGQPSSVWGFVNFTYSWYTGLRPGTIAWLGPQTCSYLERFWLAPDKRAITKNCVLGVTSEYETQSYRVKVKRRVRVNGKWVTRRVWVTRYRDVLVEVPMYGECGDYVIGTLFALQTLSHESMHLFGFGNEAQAECYGLQFFRFYASRLGADASFAQELSMDYYNRYYKVYTPGTKYFDPGCVNDGSLDLDPAPAFPRDFAPPPSSSAQPPTPPVFGR
jgi:hypothetical protein